MDFALLERLVKSKPSEEVKVHISWEYSYEM